MLDFPSPAVDDQLFSAPNGVRYKYQVPPGAWTVASSEDTPDVFEGVYNVLRFGAPGTGDVIKDTLAFQAAADAARDAGGGTVLVPSGLYIINAPIRLNSSTTVEGYGESSHIIADAALDLKRGLFENASTTITAAFQRIDRDITIRKLKFDGSQRHYPKYLVVPNTGIPGTPVTNPAQDPVRNLKSAPGVTPAYDGYVVSGYMVFFVNAICCVVEDCIFVDHESFCVDFAGCLQSGTRRNYFENCGRIDFSSNCIYIGHSGTARCITNITRTPAGTLNDTLLTLNAANTAITDYTSCYLYQIGGVQLPTTAPALPDGLYTIKSFVNAIGSVPTITLDNDITGATPFIMDGRALVCSEFFTPSEQCFSEHDRGYKLKRALIQAGIAMGVTVTSPMIRDGKEGGVFFSMVTDGIISNPNIDGITMADIVADGIELNICANIKIVSPTIRNTQGISFSVVGCVGLDVSDMTIDEPQDHLPTFTTPYGPFNEIGGLTGNLTTTNGVATATTAAIINPVTGVASTILVDMIVISPNVPAGTTVINVSGSTITMSANASGTGTAAARFNPVEGPGISLPFFQRFAANLTATGLFPIANFSINGGRIVSTNRGLAGGILLTKAGIAGTDDVRNGEIRNVDFTRAGPRGKIVGVSIANPAVITTDKPHGLTTTTPNTTVYIAGVEGPTVVNNPVVISPTDYKTTAPANEAIVGVGTTGISIGASIVAPAVPTGTVVTAIAGVTVTMSANATYTVNDQGTRFDKRHAVTYVSDTQFSINVSTVGQPVFVPSEFARWATYDPDKDVDWTSAHATDLTTLVIKDCAGTRFEAESVADVLGP